MLGFEFPTFVDFSRFDQITDWFFYFFYHFRLSCKWLEFSQIDPINSLHVFESVKEIVKLFALHRFLFLDPASFKSRKHL